MKNQKQKSVVKKRGLYIALALALFVGAPVLGAILVQNFTQWDIVVDEPPIVKLEGADEAASNGFLVVDLGQTVSNNDNGLPTPGSGDVNLAHEEITFTCFQGDRTYYTDVIQLQNTTTDTWNVTLTVEDDLAGNPALGTAAETTFSVGNADIWLFTSDQDSTGGVITELPNPGNYGSLTEWHNAAAPNGAIQLEVTAGTMSTAQATTGPFTIPTGEQRQLGLVVDCDAAMDETEIGTFRVTVSSTP